PLGIDVSAWQGDLSQQTWNNVYSAGRVFAFIRVTHVGATNGDPDTYYANNMIRARAAGLIVGPYNYARPTIQSPTTDADHFLAYAWPYITTGYLPPVLDLEEGGGTAVVGAANLSAWAIAWLNYVETETGVEPIVYCNSNYATNYLNSNLAPYTLWIANYSCACNPQTADPPAGIGIWSDWTFWQYCSSLSVGGISPVDTNAFNGTMAELQALVIGGGTVPPVITDVQATSITNSTATITWTTSAASSSQVQYGLTTGYGSTTPLDSTPVISHSVGLSGLAANTLYHYRVISTSAYGTTYSADHTFTTVGTPTISNVQATNITASGAAITWATSSPANSQVRYGLTSSYGSQTTLDPAYVEWHSVILSGLMPSTLYHYQVLSANAYGSTQSTDFTFTTTAGVADNVIDNMDSGCTTIGSWNTGSLPEVPKIGTNYLYASPSSGGVTATCTWTPTITTPGDYDVYVYYQLGSNRNPAAPYTVVYNGGQTASIQNQYSSTSYSAWFLVGSNLPFVVGTSGYVQVANNSSESGLISADAAKFVYKGSVVQPPTILQHPAAQHVCPGATVTFTVAATGDGPLSYQWQKNGGTLSNGGHYSGVATTTLTVSNVDSGDAANYACVVTNSGGSVTSSTVTLTLKAATTITSQPTARSVCAGSTATFTVIATGEGTLTYRWQKNSSNLSNGGHYSGVTTAVLTVSAVDSGDVANYRCVVTGGCGSVISNTAALSLKAPTVITVQPVGQSVCIGSTAAFTVAATGDGPLTYRWQKNGSNLNNGGHYSGVTTTTLTVSGADAGDVANYRCVVTAGCGSVISGTAALSLRAATVILQHPLPQAVPQGDTATFTVTATGDGALTYQWRKNGANLSNGGHYSGVTTATLVVSNADSGDVADYACVVTAGCGSTTSNGAGLTLATMSVDADLDGDGDVDLSDFSWFQTCFNGPNRAPLSACRRDTDFDGDGDVDLADFSTFSACFNGPNRPPACEPVAPLGAAGIPAGGL
ncbi:MAG: immunoglobulin domain-containing protein, partial [Phycisphaerae bacterium]|nr:immunoglobulin domain-containing protein [Phycisphaerae bacterium]